MSKKNTLILSLVMIFVLSGTAFAQVELGGEVKTKVKTDFKEEDISTNLQEYLNLVFYLPETQTTSGKAEFDFYTQDSSSLSSGELNSSVKKLYIKRRFDNFTASLGRQPISWSFGSLLNPVDFNLGAEVMDEATSAKHIDAVEVYYPINWNSNITAVTSVNGGETKYGVRGRTMVKGYDVTLNYVQRAGSMDAVLDRRIGVATKGDLGPIGFYSAVGYYLKPEEPIYLLGADYSFHIGKNNNRVMLQLEYLKDDIKLTPDMLGKTSTQTEQNEEQIEEFKKQIGSEFFLGNLNYSIDDFSSIGVMGIFHPEDSSGIIIPEYKNQLGSGLEFTLRGSYFAGEEKELFGPSTLTENPIEPSTPTENPIEGSIEMIFSYSF